MARQLLSSAANPPSIVHRNYLNVLEVPVVGEMCSSSEHAARDRLAIEQIFKDAPAGSILLASNPDRLGRRPEDRAYVREMAKRSGVKVYVQGVHEQPATGLIQDVSEETDKDADDADDRAEIKQKMSVKDITEWRDLDGKDKDLIDTAMQYSLIYSHEHGFYSGSTSIIDRILNFDPIQLHPLQDWLLALCTQRRVRKIVILARTSSPSKNSIRRQVTFCTMLAGKASSSGIILAKIELDDVSVWLEPRAARALDFPEYEDAIVIGTSIDRFARNESGWSAVINIPRYQCKHPATHHQCEERI